MRQGAVEQEPASQRGGVERWPPDDTSRIVVAIHDDNHVVIIDEGGLAMFRYGRRGTSSAFDANAGSSMDNVNVLDAPT